MRITQETLKDRVECLNGLIKDLKLDIQGWRYALDINGYGTKLVLRKEEYGTEKSISNYGTNKEIYNVVCAMINMFCEIKLDKSKKGEI